MQISKPIDQLSSPIEANLILTRYIVIRCKMLSIGSGFYDVKCTRLQINQDGPRCV